MSSLAAGKNERERAHANPPEARRRRQTVRILTQLGRPALFTEEVNLSGHVEPDASAAWRGVNIALAGLIVIKATLGIKLTHGTTRHVSRAISRGGAWNASSPSCNLFLTLSKCHAALA